MENETVSLSTLRISIFLLLILKRIEKEDLSNIVILNYSVR